MNEDAKEILKFFVVILEGYVSGFVLIAFGIVRLLTKPDWLMAVVFFVGLLLLLVAKQWRENS